MKGFILSIAAVTLILLLVLLFTNLNDLARDIDRSLEEPRPLSHSANVVASIGYEIAKIAGPNIRIREQNNSIILLFNDSFPKSAFQSQLASYVDFVERNLSQVVHATIDINESNLTDSQLEISIMDNYLYENNYSKNTVLFGSANSSAGTDASAYIINITTVQYRFSVQPFSFGSGDMNVTVKYSDLNGTVSENGLLQSAAQNKMIINYYYGNASSQLEITLGKTGNRTGALYVEGVNATVAFSVQATLPIQNASVPVSYKYGALINYAQSNINKTTLAVR
jgi:hypothetical protein